MLHMTHQANSTQRDFARRRGQKAVALGFAFVLSLVGIAQGLTSVPAAILHVYAAYAWPVEAAVMRESNQRSFAGKGGWLYGVRDVFQVQRGDLTLHCHWDEPVTSNVQRWIDERLVPNAWLWPVGGRVSVYLQPKGVMCEPIGGWRLAMARTTFWMALGMSACFATALMLWIWQRGLT